VSVDRHQKLRVLEGRFILEQATDAREGARTQRRMRGRRCGTVTTRRSPGDRNAERHRGAAGGRRAAGVGRLEAAVIAYETGPSVLEAHRARGARA
jgi:hypothetical protein